MVDLFCSYGANITDNIKTSLEGFKHYLVFQLS